MVVSVEGSRKLLLREDLQWVSRVCWQMSYIILNRYKPFIFIEGVSLVYLGFSKYTHYVC